MPRLYPQKQVTEALRSLRARGWGISIIHQVATQQNMSVVELAAAVEAADRERANRGLSNALFKEVE